MAKANNHILYKDGWNFSLARGFSKRRSRRFKSVKNSNNTESTLFHPLHKAFILSCTGGANVFDDTLSESETFSDNNIIAAVGKVGTSTDNLWIAEYKQSDICTHVACFDITKKEFLFAGITFDNGETYKRYVLDFKDGRNGTVLWLAMFPYLSQCSKEISDCFTLDNTKIVYSDYEDVVKKKKSSIGNNTERISFTLCDSCYWQVGNNIEVNISSTGILPDVPISEVNLGIYKPDGINFGVFHLKGIGDGTAVKKKITSISSEELFCKYSLDENMTYEQKALVPKMEDWYVVPKWVDKAAHNVYFNHKKSNLASAIKQNNLFLFGEPGSGKTEGARAIASALGLPFTHISMSANSDEFVFTGNIIPVVDGVSENSLPVLDIVKQYGGMDEFIEYAELSPDTIFKELTGTYNENATISDCVIAYATAIAKAKSKTTSNGVSYKFVESDFCKAIEQGWLVTIEEFTNVRDAGIAMVINQLMDGYQQITLPTGKVIKRHPNAVIVFASNVDEAQCGEFEASTLSRLKPMYKIETPSKSELISRVKKMTGFDDTSILETMADVVISLRNYIKDHSLVGICGVREFAGWILQYLANLDYDENSTLREAAIETIVPSASPHQEDIEDVLRDIIDTMLPLR